MKLRGEVWVGDKNVRVFSVLMILKSPNVERAVRNEGCVGKEGEEGQL